jgi:7-cyano-7-deazaguanine reductase
MTNYHETKAPEQSGLGKSTHYDAHYNPEILFAIARQSKRDEIGVDSDLPFYGIDLWNHYEVSWLNEKGKPVTAIAEIIYGCESPNIIESKSMKLYFNSFNNMKYNNVDDVRSIMQHDLSHRVGTPVIVNIKLLSEMKEEKMSVHLHGINIDNLDVECNEYKVNPGNLSTEDEIVSEILCTDLLKSNCLVTNQPDWCSVQITYHGKKIHREGLLRYIVSFRNDNEFHEQCIEKIFMHIMQYCQPTELTVYGRSTRRGGLDINSCRSTAKINAADVENVRLCRQ